MSESLSKYVIFFILIDPKINIPEVRFIIKGHFLDVNAH